MNATTHLDAANTVALSPYHYVPTKAICIMFVILFSISTLWHGVNAIRYRLWWAFPSIILASGGEVAGWVGRTISSYDVTSRTGFSIQILALILAPTPLLGSIFIIFSNLAQKIGTQYSRLTPHLYSRVFLSCDIIALLIQAGGGGIAAGAKTTSSTKMGSNIMLVGIIFQTIAMVVFMFLCIEFFIRYANDRPARKESSPRSYGRPALHAKLRMMSIALSVATLFLFTRAIYRLFELADGWNGPIISTQWYFNLFDGGMITLCLYTLNIFHPGPLLFAVPDETTSVQGEQKLAYATVESLPMQRV